MNLEHRSDHWAFVPYHFTANPSSTNHLRNRERHLSLTVTTMNIHPESNSAVHGGAHHHALLHTNLPPRGSRFDKMSESYAKTSPKLTFRNCLDSFHRAWIDITADKWVVDIVACRSVWPYFPISLGGRPSPLPLGPLARQGLLGD